MKKSNIVIFATLLIASIVFLAIWFIKGFNLVDPVDLTITIVWWFLIIGFCIAVQLIENRRQRTVRTAFIGDGIIYNSEAGLVRFDTTGTDAYVRELRRILDDLDYGTKTPSVPSKNRVRFKYIVRSSRFSQNGKVWEGEVVQLANGNQTKSFHNEKELSALLAA